MPTSPALRAASIKYSIGRYANISQLGNTTECSICLEKYGWGPDFQIPLRTHCGHIYCRTCLTRWCMIVMSQSEDIQAVHTAEPAFQSSARIHPRVKSWKLKWRMANKMPRRHLQAQIPGQCLPNPHELKYQAFNGVSRRYFQFRMPDQKISRTTQESVAAHYSRG